MEFFSIFHSNGVPTYPTSTMLGEMQTIIRNQFQGDQDGADVDTACCYVPQMTQSVMPITLFGCDTILLSNRGACFAALGPHRIGIVDQIMGCVGTTPTDFCLKLATNSSFLARTNSFGAPDDAAFWAPTYLKLSLVTRLGSDAFENGTGPLINPTYWAWDGTAASNECSTVYGPQVAIPDLGVRCLCHLDCLTSDAAQLRSGVACTATGSISCQNGLCDGAPVDPECEFLGCDSDSDTICDGGGGGAIGDNLCPDKVTIDCDDNCQFFSNPLQEDSDGDEWGDACDLNPGCFNSCTEFPQCDDDGDGILTDCDSCPFTHNPAQIDTDGDLLGDVCDDDDDDDLLFDFVETNTGVFVDPNDTGTNPLIADADSDGFMDGLEVLAGSDPNDGSDQPADTDGDGVVGLEDNCSATSNASQLDTNSDGFGNACDADYGNTGSVGGSDFILLSQAFGCVDPDPCYDPDLDSGGDGAIGGPEFILFNQQNGRPPGPSGLACAGTVPCP